MLSEEQILEIRQRADIVDVISDYRKVISKGKSFASVCPFHDDHSPSMMINKEKQIYKCFSCGAGGNVFTFVMNYENVSFIEAVKIVADKIGVNLNVKNYNDNTTKHHKDYEIMSLAKKYYLNNINTEAGLEAKKYLIDRGINKETIEEFEIGFAQNEKDSLTNFFTKQDYDLNTLENLGLSGKNGIDIYDSFRNRIMVPITNISGNVVGFTGRIFHGEDTAKYVNTKETHIFKKSSILFNYYNAKNYIRNTKSVIVVEGNMDAIKMHSCGFKNVVALMGTALTNEHVNALKKLGSKIILMLDNDEAGKNATVKNGDILLEKNLEVEIIRLSGAKDPDEYLNKFGNEAMLNNINNPINFIDFKIEILKENKNLNSSIDLANFVKELLISIKHLDDITKGVIIDKISSEYKIDKEILKAELIIDKPFIPKVEVIKEPKNTTSYEKLANIILYYIASDPKFLKIYKKDLNFFKNKEERDLAKEIDYFYKNNPSAYLADFMTYVSSKEDLNNKLQSIITDLTEEELDHSKFVEYINLMKKKLDDEEIKEILIKIKNEFDIDKKIKLMERLTKIKKGSVENE